MARLRAVVIVALLALTASTGSPPVAAAPVRAPEGAADLHERAAAFVRHAPPEAPPEPAAAFSSQRGRLEGQTAKASPFCWEQFYPDAADTVLLDIAEYGLSYECGPREWVAGALTYDTWPTSDLDGYFLDVDTDRTFANGCEGADVVVLSYYDFGLGALVGGALRTPTCDDRSWSDLGPVDVGRGGSSDFVGMAFPHRILGNPSSFRWRMDLAYWIDGGVIDAAPSETGWRTASGFATPPPPTCDVSTTAFTPKTAPTVNGSYDALVAGDFDANGHEDVFLYGTGGRSDGLLRGSPSRGLAAVTGRAVNGSYDLLAAGDFDGDRREDIYFYGRGTRADGLLRGSVSRVFVAATAPQVNGVYQAVVAEDFNGDGYDDLYFYGAGSAADGQLRGSSRGLVATSAKQVSGTYDVLAAGDMVRDGFADVFLYGRGTRADGLLRGSSRGLVSGAARAVNGTFGLLAAGDFNGDRATDVLFYGTGTACEGLLRGSGGGMNSAAAPRLNGTYDRMVAGDFTGDGRGDVFLYGAGSRGEGMLLGR